MTFDELKLKTLRAQTIVNELEELNKFKHTDSKTAIKNGDRLSGHLMDKIYTYGILKLIEEHEYELNSILNPVPNETVPNEPKLSAEYQTPIN